jgi:hypothetical protein
MYAGVQVLGASIDVLMGASVCLCRERWRGMGRRVFALRMQRASEAHGQNKEQVSCPSESVHSGQFLTVRAFPYCPCSAVSPQFRRSVKLAACAFGRVWNGGLYEIAVGAHRVDLLP